MYWKKKEKLYLYELMDDPVINYPAYYILSTSLIGNEMLHSAIVAIHSCEFGWYQPPKSFDDIFKMFDQGSFPLYREKYIVGYFGGKMMYLESHGWKAMPVTSELFDPSNWLVY